MRGTELRHGGRSPRSPYFFKCPGLRQAVQKISQALHIDKVPVIAILDFSIRFFIMKNIEKSIVRTNMSPIIAWCLWQKTGLTVEEVQRTPLCELRRKLWWRFGTMPARALRNALP